MGNTGSTGVSWWSAYEIAAKNFDPQHFPIAVNAAGVANVTAENAVIFNIGTIMYLYTHVPMLKICHPKPCI